MGKPLGEAGNIMMNLIHETSNMDGNYAASMFRSSDDENVVVLTIREDNDNAELFATAYYDERLGSAMLEFTAKDIPDSQIVKFSNAFADTFDSNNISNFVVFPESFSEIDFDSVQAVELVDGEKLYLRFDDDEYLSLKDRAIHRISELKDDTDSSIIADGDIFVDVHTHTPDAIYIETNEKIISVPLTSYERSDISKFIDEKEHDSMELGE